MSEFSRPPFADNYRAWDKARNSASKRQDEFFLWAERALQSFRILLYPLGFEVNGEAIVNPNLDHFSPQMVFKFSHTWPNRNSELAHTFPSVRFADRVVVLKQQWERDREKFDRPTYIIRVAMDLARGLFESRLMQGAPIDPNEQIEIPAGLSLGESDFERHIEKMRQDILDAACPPDLVKRWLNEGKPLLVDRKMVKRPEGVPGPPLLLDNAKPAFTMARCQVEIGVMCNHTHCKRISDLQDADCLQREITRSGNFITLPADQVVVKDDGRVYLKPLSPEDREKALAAIENAKTSSFIVLPQGAVVENQDGKVVLMNPEESYATQAHEVGR